VKNRFGAERALMTGDMTEVQGTPWSQDSRQNVNLKQKKRKGN
jgi:hypothetical protein